MRRPKRRTRHFASPSSLRAAELMRSVAPAPLLADNILSGTHFLDSTLPVIAGTPRLRPLRASGADLMTAEAYIDPSRLIASRLFIPYNPSVLVSRKGLNIYDQMKMDEQVKATLSFKKLAALSPGWEVTSPGDQDEAWEVTAFVRDVFNHLPGGMDGALKKIMLGLDYGYSVTEKIYEQGTGMFEGKVVLAKLNSIKPHYIDFRQDEFGVLLSLIQRLVPGQSAAKEEELPVDKFVLYTHDCEFENPYGRSDLEACYRPWWVKDNAYKWLAVMLERYGMPPLFLFYDQNAYQGAQLDELKKIVRNIQNATMGIIPRATKDSAEFAKLEMASAAKEVFLSALGRFDSDIAKGMLMPTHVGMTTETKEQGAGSYARSNVHFKMFMYVISELQRSVSTTAVNTQIIRQLCDLNYPGLKSYPHFGFLSVDDETELELFKTWTEMVSGKVVNRIEDDERHIRKSLGFPVNDSIVIEDLPSDALAAAKGGAEVPPGDQSKAMQEYAEENDGVWIYAGGHQVCVSRNAWDESKHPRHGKGSGAE